MDWMISTIIIRKWFFGANFNVDSTTDWNQMKISDKPITWRYDRSEFNSIKEDNSSLHFIYAKCLFLPETSYDQNTVDYYNQWYWFDRFK